MEIEAIIAELQGKGASPEEIMASLQQMLEAGQISQEDFDKALALLGAPTDAEAEKAEASRLLGATIA